MAISKYKVTENHMSTQIAGRRVIITGAASGIGRATAQLLAAENERLFLLDRLTDQLTTICTELNCSGMAVDLANQEATQHAVQKALDHLGGVDAVINVAGITRKRLVEDMMPVDWADLLNINLLAPFWIIQAALADLRNGENPSIVNVSSGTALRPTIHGYSAYAATKGGLVTMTKALAFELAPEIRVNAVCPGAAMTAMLSAEGAAMATGADSPYALKRAACPEEIAEAIKFLSSPSSSYITGSALAADGGRTFY